jgi:hypothetical protein
MKLIWTLYNKGRNQAKHKLYLDLGAEGNKRYVLAAEGLDKDDISTIRQQANNLDRMTLAARITWIKSTCPSAMKQFRSLTQKKLSVLKEYDIKST